MYWDLSIPCNYLAGACTEPGPSRSIGENRKVTYPEKQTIR